MTDHRTQALRRAAAAGDAEAEEALALAVQRAEHQIDPMHFTPTIGTRRGRDLPEGHVWATWALTADLIGWGECERGVECGFVGRLDYHDSRRLDVRTGHWFCDGCGKRHEEYWDAMWYDYHAGLL